MNRNATLNTLTHNHHSDNLTTTFTNTFNNSTCNITLHSTCINNVAIKLVPCLKHILSYLSKSDIVTAALVSKSWKEIALKQLWSSFKFAKEKEFEKIFHILSKKPTMQYGEYIKSIELIQSEKEFNLNSSHIYLITLLCPNLESISITFHQINRAVVPPPIHRQPQKTAHLPVPMLQRQQQQYQQQRQFTISLPLVHFSYNCPKLKRIKLDSYSPKTDDSVYEMAKYMNSNSLENIILTNCNTIQSSTLCKLAIMNPNLKNIEITGTTPITDSSFATIIDRCGKYLEYLNITNAYQLTDKSIRYIPSRCKKIKNICILNNNTESISEDTLTNIITHCPTLEMISLSDSKCLGSLFFDSVVQRINIEITSIYRHQLTVNKGLQKLCLGGVKRDMIQSKYMKELIDKSAGKNDEPIFDDTNEQVDFIPKSTIIRGNTVWWQRQRLLITSST